MQTSVTQNESTKESVTLYHWLVVVIASCGWLFDCMDQRFFILARESALKELLGSDAAALAEIKKYIGYATTSMIVGWATGGIIFGMLSDKWGRVKTMVATLLVYSGFTGLSGFAQSWQDFTVYRFLVGLGVGGMFGAATTLVAESVPGRFRSVALGSLQALSATGNIIGSLITLWIPPGTANFWGQNSGWRVVFFVGILPALLTIPIVFVLREPEVWRQAKAAAAQGLGLKRIGSPIELFLHPRWRRNAIIGLLLGVAGMVGLWGIGFYSPELVTTALKDTPLQTQDLKDPQKICQAVRTARSPAAAHFKTQLSQATQSQLAEWNPGQSVPLDLQKTLADDLNRMVQEGNLYRIEAFKTAASEAGTQKLLKQIESAPQKAERLDVLYLNRQLLEQAFAGSVADLQGHIDHVRGKALALQDVGAFIGMMVFTLVASVFGRRPAFLGSFALCLGITMWVFNSLKTESDAYWMLPMMGFAQLAVFAGYSIYFPELFPTRLRGTGVGFCYNTVRYLAAPAPMLLGYLSTVLSFRTAAMVMSSIYLLGMIALIWAPETKGQPLPED